MTSPMLRKPTPTSETKTPNRQTGLQAKIVLTRWECQFQENRNTPDATSKTGAVEQEESAEPKHWPTSQKCLQAVERST